jgi:hypothetical protein
LSLVVVVVVLIWVEAVVLVVLLSDPHHLVLDRIQLLSVVAEMEQTLAKVRQGDQMAQIPLLII